MEEEESKGVRDCCHDECQVYCNLMLLFDDDEHQSD